jgi:hypothetical protein
MADLLRCPSCGAQVADDRGELDRPGRCGKCGAFLASRSADWNPYNPPSAPLSGEGEDFLSPLEVPSSVFGKLGLAFRLFNENLVLISVIMLTVWLPANIMLDFYQFDAPEGQELRAIRLNSMVDGIFGPIALGALVFAVDQRMKGKKVGYPEAIGVGFRNWGRLFAANFFAGIFILLGFVCLIVPGIILIVRYALLNPVVILERASAPRQRSTELTAGRRWQIVAAGLLFFAIFIPIAFVVGAVVGFAQINVEWLNNPWVNVVGDCVLNVVSSLFTILMVLFYLEARHNESAKVSAGPRDDDLFYSTKMAEPL